MPKKKQPSGKHLEHVYIDTPHKFAMFTRTIRQLQGKTRKQLAMETAYALATVGKIENAQTVPGLNGFILICDALGYDVVLEKRRVTSTTEREPNNE